MRIVLELGLEDSVDTLGRWMSHRIAELMERSEQAGAAEEKEAARRECSDLILQVWARRKYWSQGQPLNNLSRFINSLTPDSHPASHKESVPPELNWVEALPLLRNLQEREDEVVLNTAIADLELEQDQEWLENHPNELSEEERQTITWLVNKKESLNSTYFKVDGQYAHNFTSMTPSERAHLTFEALERINLKRQEILTVVKRNMDCHPEDNLG